MSTRLEYRPDVDGMRAIAALAVVAVHTNYLPGGFAGVDVFFVISGYLITGIIRRELEEGRFSCLAFYSRRVRRIFPALIVVTAAVLLAGSLILLSGEFRLLGRDIAGGAAFVLNLVLTWVRDPIDLGQLSLRPRFLDHFWSLGVEEQFYLLWPAFLLIIWPFPKRRILLIAVIASLSFLASVLMSSSDPVAAYRLPWTRLWQLAAGGLLALIEAEHADSSPTATAKPAVVRYFASRADLRHICGLAGAVLIAAAFVGLDPMRLSNLAGWSALLPTSGAVLLIAAGPRSYINRYVLSAAPLVFIGLISYPLYLWHWPLMYVPHLLEWPSPMTFRATLCTIGISFLLAFLTYRYVELPIKTSRRGARVTTALCLAMAVCAGAGYLIFIGKISAPIEPADVRKLAQAAMEAGEPSTRNLPGALALPHISASGPEFRRTLFFGDSSMEQYYPRIADLSNTQAAVRGAVFIVSKGCTTVPADFSEYNAPDPFACTPHVQHVLSYEQDRSVDTVVIGACWYCMFVSYGGQFGAAGPLKPDAVRAFDRVQEIVGRFTSANKRVYLLLDTPVGVQFDPRQMIRRNLFPPRFEVNRSSPSRTAINTALEPVSSKIRQIAASAGASVIDPMDVLCDGETCRSVSVDGEPLYRDSRHLRASFVRANASFLDQTLVNDRSNGDGDSE